MWIPITLAAATFQILRTSRQHQLRAALSVNGAGFVRYAYGFPLAVIWSPNHEGGKIYGGSSANGTCSPSISSQALSAISLVRLSIM